MVNNATRHFGSYQPGKLRGTQHKGRNRAVKSNQLKIVGQDSTKSVFTTMLSLLQSQYIYILLFYVLHYFYFNFPFAQYIFFSIALQVITESYNIEDRIFLFE